MADSPVQGAPCADHIGGSAILSPELAELEVHLSVEQRIMMLQEGAVTITMHERFVTYNLEYPCI